MTVPRHVTLVAESGATMTGSGQMIMPSRPTSCHF
jgi:hypothetical protein